NVQLAHDKDELQRNKERVESLLSALASREVAQQFLQSNEELGFEGNEAEATILFADIRGFTPMCERLSTEEVFELLNTYFARMRAVIDRYEGTILKFMGDALMASWNVPAPLDLHAARAVYAGIDMQREIRAINKEREAAGKEPLQVGIGINTGKVMLGAIGTRERFDFTVIGDAVNTAQRIESITPAQHLHVSQSTWEQVKDYIEVVARDPVTLKGKEHPVSIYAVLHRSRTPAHFRTREERAGSDDTVRITNKEPKK
ncbi:MAG TPA: adenylate/guanylate cyclase domain-containing protein, partial [bacterium]|nr:adenylate/guanylate cyclase domain-containing protein [bacterium]